MDNMAIYNAVRDVPQIAKRTIGGGRLKGKTDINPMWRIKTLTENFGPCGVGWKAPIRKQWLEAGANGEVMAFCNIELFVKVDGEWSEGIDGTGGAAAVSKENEGYYTDDECYKKAYTDAISVACKMLGFGADVYWEKDSTKYSERPQTDKPPAQKPVVTPTVAQQSPEMLKAVNDKANEAAAVFGKSAGQIKTDACNALRVTGLNDDELRVIIKWMDEQMAKVRAQ